MKVVKPGKLSVVTRCFEHNRRYYLGVSVMAFVPMTGEPNLLGEIAMWKFVPDRLALPVLDEGTPKARAEFLVDGSAYAPQGVAVPGVPIRARVGSVEKTLEVRGDRYWRGNTATEARPFAHMRLGWDRAYGGPEYAQNPLGKGDAEVEIEGVMIRPLPNVEYSRQLVDSPRARPEPACMLPIDVSWPQRSRLAGTYDGEWLETLFPGLAADADWGLFNLAAADQQRPEWWSPRERFRFDNMHPTKPVLEGELPGYVARAFIKRRVRRALVDERGEPTGEEQVSERFTEIPLVLGTLWFFPDAEQAVVIFQGSARIREDDGSDVLALLVAAENEGQARSVDHYEQALRDRMVKSENAAIVWLRESDLLPEGLPDVPDASIAEEIELNAHEGLLQQNMHNRKVRETERARAMLVELGLDPDVHGPPIPEPPTPPPTPAELPALAAKLVAEAEKRGEEELANREAKLQSIGAMIDELGIPGFTAETLREEVMAPAPVGPPEFTAAAQIAMIRELAAECRASGTVVDELEEMSVDEELHARWRGAEAKLRDAYRETAHLQHPAPAMAEDLQPKARARVQAALAAGEDFAALNLTGADLSNMDLRGAKLAGAFLESARFDGADLRGADLRGAVLAHASLQRVTLDGADMRKANVGGATIRETAAVGVDLREAILAKAKLEAVDLRGAKLGGANLFEANLSQVDLSEAEAEASRLLSVGWSGVRLAGAKLKGSTFIELDLDATDFSGADLSGVTLVTCTARRAKLAGATLTGFRAVQGCTLDGAILTEAALTQANLRGTSMVECELSKANLDGADLSECDLRRARLYQTVARGTRFERANLEDAVLLSANLMQASFMGATIRGVDLRAANLHAADMARVRTDDRVQLGEALLTKVRVNPRYDPALDQEPEDLDGRPS